MQSISDISHLFQRQTLTYVGDGKVLETRGSIQKVCIRAAAPLQN